MDNQIQGLMYSVYLTDVYGTTTPFNHVNEIREYLMKPDVSRQVSEKTGCTDIDGVVTRGLEQSKLRNKDHPDFIKYVELFEEAAILGYKAGKIRMPLEDGVLETLEQIRNLSGRVRIFSSANESARFGMQTNGLDSLIEGYHSSVDPAIKTKFSPEAYTEIARQIGVQPKEIVYVTDDTKEADAAVKAGVGKVFLIDKKQAEAEKDGYTVIHDYKQVLEKTVKTIKIN